MPPTTNQTAALTLSAGRHKARKAAPYLGALLTSLIVREAPGYGTVGTSINLIMAADYEVVATWTADQMAFVWLHEVLHAQLQFFKRLGARDHKVFNIAQDIVINQMLLQMGLIAPTKPKPCLPEGFGLPPGLTSDAYYDLLMQQANAAPQGGGSKPGDGDGSVCAGHCGGIAGTPHEGEEATDAADPTGRTPAEVHRALRATAEAIRAHAQQNPNGAGSVPGDLLRWADAMIAPPKVRWQDKLARTCRHAVQYRPGAAVHAFNRPSRRQAGIGYGVGRPTMPHVRQPVPKIMVVIDTSGSMGEAEGAAALAEVNGIMRATGAEVSFSACDASATAPKSVATIQQAMKLLVGGGGTLFEPAIIAAERAQPRPDVLIFITDGGNFDNPVIPSWLRPIFVLVGDHRCQPTLQGAVDIIEIDD